MVTTKRTTNAKPRVANPREVAKVVVTLKDEHVQCRALGHQWTVNRVKAETRGLTWVWIWCERCSWAKSQLISRDGEVLQRKTEPYPEGYLFKDLGQLDAWGRMEIRKDLVRRAKEHGVTAAS